MSAIILRELYNCLVEENEEISQATSQIEINRILFVYFFSLLEKNGEEAEGNVRVCRNSFNNGKQD